MALVSRATLLIVLSQLTWLTQSAIPAEIRRLFGDQIPESAFPAQQEQRPEEWDELSPEEQEAAKEGMIPQVVDAPPQVSAIIRKAEQKKGIVPMEDRQRAAKVAKEGDDDKDDSEDTDDDDDANQNDDDDDDDDAPSRHHHALAHKKSHHKSHHHRREDDDDDNSDSDDDDDDDERPEIGRAHV